MLYFRFLNPAVNEAVGIRLLPHSWYDVNTLQLIDLVSHRTWMIKM
jgi:hypothetical protein